MWPVFDWLLGGGPKAVGEGVKAVADGATGGADHYHRDDVRPSWARGRRPIRIIGRHWFYKLGKTGLG